MADIDRLAHTMVVVLVLMDVFFLVGGTPTSWALGIIAGFVLGRYGFGRRDA